MIAFYFVASYFVLAVAVLSGSVVWAGGKRLQQLDSQVIVTKNKGIGAITAALLVLLFVMLIGIFVVAGFATS
jgi:O-antigen/teichoic acid export membrane protein